MQMISSSLWEEKGEQRGRILLPRPRSHSKSLGLWPGTPTESSPGSAPAQPAPSMQGSGGCTAHGTAGEKGLPPLLFFARFWLALTRNQTRLKTPSSAKHRRRHRRA